MDADDCSLVCSIAIYKSSFDKRWRTQRFLNNIWGNCTCPRHFLWCSVVALIFSFDHTGEKVVLFPLDGAEVVPQLQGTAEVVLLHLDVTRGKEVGVGLSLLSTGLEVLALGPLSTRVQLRSQERKRKKRKGNCFSYSVAEALVH